MAYFLALESLLEKVYDMFLTHYVIKCFWAIFPIQGNVIA
jgi:hypothetical protein